MLARSGLGGAVDLLCQRPDKPFTEPDALHWYGWIVTDTIVCYGQHVVGAITPEPDMHLARTAVGEGVFHGVDDQFVQQKLERFALLRGDRLRLGLDLKRDRPHVQMHRPQIGRQPDQQRGAVDHVALFSARIEPGIQAKQPPPA